MSCPWAKIENVEAISLMDIMSEEIARDLQSKEDKKLSARVDNTCTVAEVAAALEDIPDKALQATSDDSIESDAMIARMLQMHFDKEYDGELKRIEEKFNGSSKVSISFDNYRRATLNNDFESDIEDETTDILDRKDWDRFDVLNKEIASIPPCGYKKLEGGKMITKHDVIMNGIKNACKLMSFPPEFHTGDGENFDLKLSNKVFNSLRKHSKHEQVRRHKMLDKKEDRATAEFGMDQSTRILLYKLINKQLLQKVNGVISIGKEAVILHADSDPSYPDATEELPKECVIKVFKTTLSEFKQRDKYIKDDFRFKDRIGKQTSKKTIKIWTEKEMANLMRLKKAGIRCPQVVTHKQHILVMSFIGEDHNPAPKLKDAIMDPVDYITAYEEVVEAMKTLYDKANLIHADLSEYNILWHNKHCYFIDVSQSVEPTHENAFSFLFRDCSNIIKFFSKKGVPGIVTVDELFELITGCSFNNKVELEQSIKAKPHLMDRPGVDIFYNFDTAWEKTKTGKLPVNLQTAAEVEKVITELDVPIVEPLKA